MISIEQEYLTELMTEFPVQNNSIGSVEVAEELLKLRYQELADFVDSGELLNRLRTVDQSRFPLIFLNFAKTAHSRLFARILSNAGQYRQPTDPKGGVVYFGRQKDTEPEFRGTPANEIERILPNVFQYLSKNNSTPIVSAVIFYQQFVHVHPFYDANGRISRLLVSIYLDYHDCYVRWNNLETQPKWLKKLNACHKRQGQPEQYDKYLGYLVTFFSKHVRPKSDFELKETTMP